MEQVDMGMLKFSCQFIKGGDDNSQSLITCAFCNRLYNFRVRKKRIISLQVSVNTLFFNKIIKKSQTE